MKKLNLVLLATLGFLCTGFGQYAAVNFDPEKNYFNEGQPLPAEKNLMFTGLVPEAVDIIEISIFPNKAKNEKSRLYLASWRDFDNSANTSFSLSVNYPLRASEKYDFRLDFYRKLEANAQKKLNESIIALVTSYLDANIGLKGNSLALAKGEKKIVAELNEIVTQALHEYRTQEGAGFQGFSTTINQKLAQIEKVDFGKLPKDTLAIQAKDKRQTTVLEKSQELQLAITSEINNIMDKQWSKLSTTHYVDDYETEQKKGSFSFNVGYGGIYLDGNLDDFTYGASPYVGLSFPLANSTLAPKFMRNSSLTIGAFLDSFEDQDGNKVSGVIINQPLYLGLDYKLFEFVRFNAGAAFLEKTTMTVPDNGIDMPKTNKNIFIRPFIGLSARIDLSIGFGK